jgi:GH25 family lysozyme M1 (1,4-beta-N-acetylmuramidase)
MNGIDISGHQNGIDLSVVPCDFVIIKATQGTSFVSKDFRRQVEQALMLGKLTGVYHYANGAGVNIEADHFIDVVKPYLGKVILCLDWENNKDKYGNNDNPKFAAGDYKYCEQLLVAIQKKTGITPFLYMSKSVARQYKWEVGKNFPFWCAQYKNYNPTGYQKTPWTDSKGWGAWTGCKILQYSSKGLLKGYNADLDLDLAYIDGDEWLRWAQGDLLPEQPTDIRPVLKRGDKNEYVRAWQEYLNANGYCCGNADGIFGQKTQDALVKWQQDRGMESGYVGQKSWELLDS